MQKCFKPAYVFSQLHLSMCNLSYCITGGQIESYQIGCLLNWQIVSNIKSVLPKQYGISCSLRKSCSQDYVYWR